LGIRALFTPFCAHHRQCVPPFSPSRGTIVPIFPLTWRQFFTPWFWKRALFSFLFPRRGPGLFLPLLQVILPSRHRAFFRKDCYFLLCEVLFEVVVCGRSLHGTFLPSGGSEWVCLRGLVNRLMLTGAFPGKQWPCPPFLILSLLLPPQRKAQLFFPPATVFPALVPSGDSEPQNHVLTTRRFQGKTVPEKCPPPTIPTPGNTPSLPGRLEISCGGLLLLILLVVMPSPFPGARCCAINSTCALPFSKKMQNGPFSNPTLARCSLSPFYSIQSGYFLLAKILCPSPERKEVAPNLRRQTSAFPFW